MNSHEAITIELQQLAIKFRTNDEPTALKEVNPLIDKIISEPEILIKCDINTLSKIVFEMQECIGRNDFLGLADYLAYDLIQIIK